VTGAAAFADHEVGHVFAAQSFLWDDPPR
jgi:hypothetical protein